MAEVEEAECLVARLPLTRTAVVFVAELVDARGLQPCSPEGVRVRIPPETPLILIGPVITTSADDLLFHTTSRLVFRKA